MMTSEGLSLSSGAIFNSVDIDVLASNSTVSTPSLAVAVAGNAAVVPLWVMVKDTYPVAGSYM